MKQVLLTVALFVSSGIGAYSVTPDIMEYSFRRSSFVLRLTFAGSLVKRNISGVEYLR